MKKIPVEHQNRTDDDDFNPWGHLGIMTKGDSELCEHILEGIHNVLRLIIKTTFDKMTASFRPCACPEAPCMSNICDQNSKRTTEVSSAAGR